jgi:hypothetical protein
MTQSDNGAKRAARYWRTNLFLLSVIAAEGFILVLRNGHP